MDQILTVLLSTSCLVGGCIGLIMDNILPGKYTLLVIINFYIVFFFYQNVDMHTQW